jgi:hypothetical protein
MNRKKSKVNLAQIRGDGADEQQLTSTDASTESQGEFQAALDEETKGQIVDKAAVKSMFDSQNEEEVTPEDK